MSIVPSAPALRRTFSTPAAGFWGPDVYVIDFPQQHLYQQQTITPNMLLVNDQCSGTGMMECYEDLSDVNQPVYTFNTAEPIRMDRSHTIHCMDSDHMNAAIPSNNVMATPLSRPIKRSASSVTILQTPQQLIMDESGMITPLTSNIHTIDMSMGSVASPLHQKSYSQNVTNNMIFLTPHQESFLTPISTPANVKLDFSQHRQNHQHHDRPQLEEIQDSLPPTPASIATPSEHMNAAYQSSSGQTHSFGRSYHVERSLSDCTLDRNWSAPMPQTLSDMNPAGSGSIGFNPFYSPPSFLSQRQSDTSASSPINADSNGRKIIDSREISPPLSLDDSDDTLESGMVSPKTTISSSSSSMMTPPSPVMSLDDNERNYSLTKSKSIKAADYALILLQKSSTEIIPRGNKPYQHKVSKAQRSFSGSKPGLASKTENEIDLSDENTGLLETELDLGHVRMKSSEKPHRCPECHKGFRRLEHVKRHAKVHTKEKPYQCEVHECGRRFSRRDNLRAHRKTHAKRGGRNCFVEGLDS